MSMNNSGKKELRRSRHDSWIFGVCGGLADYFGISSGLMRLLAFISFWMSGSLTFWAYIIMTIVLRKEPRLPKQHYAAQHYAPQHYAPQHYAPQQPVRQQAVYVQNLGQRKLERVVQNARHHAPPEIKEQVESIYSTARNILPQLENSNKKLRPVKEAVLEYFPDTLESYLRLPPDYAESYVLPDGNTPKEKLMNDLEVIDESLKKTAASFYQRTIQKGSKGLEALRQTLDADPMRDVRRSLQKLEEQIDASSLPDEALDKIQNISVTIQALLPQLLRDGGSGDYNVYNLRQTALDYLPDAVEKYLSMPTTLAETQLLSNGQTAYQTFMAQLNLLEDTVLNMMTSAYQNDANGLLVHGRFLEEKFANSRIELSI